MDSLLLVGFGFAAWKCAPTMIGGEQGESQDPKRLALMRKAGLALLLIGAAMFLVDLLGA